MAREREANAAGQSMADRMRQVRTQQGLTMAEFGARMMLSQTAISLMESGKAKITDRTVKQICDTWKVSEQWLRNGEGTMEKQTYTQQLAELLNDLPEEQREFIACHLLGTVQGMKMQDALNKDKKSA